MRVKQHGFVVIKLFVPNAGLFNLFSQSGKVYCLLHLQHISFGIIIYASNLMASGFLNSKNLSRFINAMCSTIATD